jgi:hypothetical protein
MAVTVLVVQLTSNCWGMMPYTRSGALSARTPA